MYNAFGMKLNFFLLNQIWLQNTNLPEIMRPIYGKGSYEIMPVHMSWGSWRCAKVIFEQQAAGSAPWCDAGREHTRQLGREDGDSSMLDSAVRLHSQVLWSKSIHREIEGTAQER